jgi:hypothetical protein
MLLSLLPFLYRRRAGVEVRGKHSLTGLEAQPKALDLRSTVVLRRCQAQQLVPLMKTKEVLTVLTLAPAWGTWR